MIIDELPMSVEFECAFIGVDERRSCCRSTRTLCRRRAVRHRAPRWRCRRTRGTARRTTRRITSARAAAPAATRTAARCATDMNASAFCARNRVVAHFIGWLVNWCMWICCRGDPKAHGSLRYTRWLHCRHSLKLVIRHEREAKRLSCKCTIVCELFFEQRR